jgi:hypothetical protein
MELPDPTGRKRRWSLVSITVFEFPEGEVTGLVRGVRVVKVLFPSEVKLA